MTAQVNGIVGGALDTLGDITCTPPAAMSSSDSAVRLRPRAAVPMAAAPAAGHRVAPGSHRFVLELRPRSGAGLGGSSPSGSTNPRR